MIEPLRFNMEKALPFSVDRPVFCAACQWNKATRKNPNIAVKYCPDCPKLKYLCRTCDELAHDMVAGPPHVRRILVVGPAVRKKVLVRGDRKNFPLPMDLCQIQLSSQIYHEGALIHKEEPKDIEFVAGLSGKSCHVQILGAGDLLAADDNGTSDPFITAIYNGVPMHTTRYRQRTLNPRWNNESIIVPLSDNLPDARGALRSQHQLLKLEMYDYDWWNANDFLGHVEITKSKLQKLAERSNHQPVRLPLTLREFHGLLGIQMGMKDRNFFIKIVRGECLDKMDPTGLSDPYVKVFFGDKYLGKTPVHSNTLDPTWTVFNTFKLNVNDVIRREKSILREKRSMGPSRTIDDEARLSLFRLELYDFNYFRAHGHLGSVTVPVEYLRKMCNFVPKMIMSEQSFKHKLLRLGSRSNSKLDSGGSFMNVSSRWFNTADDDDDADLNNDDALHPEIDENHDHQGEEEDIFNMIKNHANSKSLKMVKSPPTKPPLGPTSSKLADKRKGLLNSTEFYNTGVSMSNMSPIIEKNGDEGSASSAFSAANAAHPLATPFIRSSSMKPRPLPPAEFATEFNPSPDNDMLPVPHCLDTPELGSISPLSLPPEVEGVVNPSTNATETVDTGTVHPCADDDAAGTGAADVLRVMPDISTSDPSAGEMRARAESISAAPMLGSGSRKTIKNCPNSPCASTLVSVDGAGPPSPLTVSRPNSAAGQEQHNSRPSTAGRDSDRSNNNNNDMGGNDHGNSTEVMIVGDVGDAQMLSVSDSAPDAMLSNLDPIKETDQSSIVDDGSHKGEEKGEGVEIEEEVEEEKDEDEEEEEEEGSEDDEVSDEDDKIKNFVGRIRSGFSSMRSGFMSMFESDKEFDKEAALQKKKDAEIKWSNLRHFPVIRQVCSANVVEPDNVERGYILARLVISNRGNVVPGLDEGIRQMTLGETSLLKVRFDYAYNSYAMGANIPPRSNIVFKVHLKAINEMGMRGMPWRQVKRFSRMARRCLERSFSACTYAIMKIVRTKQVAWLMKFLFNIHIDLGEDDHESDAEEEEEEESSEDEAVSLETFATVELTDEDHRMRKHLNSQIVAGARVLWGFKNRGPVNNEERFKRLRSPEELAKIAKKRAREKRKRKEAERERLAKIHEEEEERQWLIDHGELDPDAEAVDAHLLLADGSNHGGNNNEEPVSPPNEEEDGRQEGRFLDDSHRVMSEDGMEGFVVDGGNGNFMQEDDISTVGGGVHFD